MATETSSVDKARQPAALRLEDVHFAYPAAGESSHDVMLGLDVQIDYGKIVGLVGRNGSGKSTLLDIIRGKLVPQRGQVRVGKTLVSADSRLVNLPQVGVISQRPDAGLAPTMTVYENYVLATDHERSSLRWAYSSQRARGCRDLLAKANMDLEVKHNEQVRFLSGGQQQALSILLALQSSAPILLMDEPTAALDPFAAERVLDLAISETDSRKGSLLLVSHRIRDIVERCSRILVLRGGKIGEDIDTAARTPTEQDLLGIMANSTSHPRTLGGTAQ